LPVEDTREVALARDGVQHYGTTPVAAWKPLTDETCAGLHTPPPTRLLTGVLLQAGPSCWSHPRTARCRSRDARSAWDVPPRRHVVTMLRKVCGGARGECSELGAASYSPLETTATTPRIHLDTDGEDEALVYLPTFAGACSFLLNDGRHFVRNRSGSRSKSDWMVLKSEPLGVEASKSWLQ